MDEQENQFEELEARILAVEALVASLPDVDDAVIQAAREQLAKSFEPGPVAAAFRARLGRKARKKYLHALAEGALEEIAAARPLTP